MKNKIITGFGSVIALLYTVLIVLAVDGIDRAGIINGVMDLLGFENRGVYGVLLFTLCVVVLIFYYIVISNRKSNVIAMMLIVSLLLVLSYWG